MRGLAFDRLIALKARAVRDADGILAFRLMFLRDASLGAHASALLYAYCCFFS